MRIASSRSCPCRKWRWTCGPRRRALCSARKRVAWSLQVFWSYFWWCRALERCAEGPRCRCRQTEWRWSANHLCRSRSCRRECSFGRRPVPPTTRDRLPPTFHAISLTENIRREMTWGRKPSKVRVYLAQHFLSVVGIPLACPQPSQQKVIVVLWP